MTAKDLFGLFVRLAGLVMGLYGIYALIFSVIEAYGFFEKVTHTSADFAIFGFAMIVMGWAVLFFAERITNFAYPQRLRRDE